MCIPTFIISYKCTNIYDPVTLYLRKRKIFTFLSRIDSQKNAKHILRKHVSLEISTERASQVLIEQKKKDKIYRMLQPV